MTASQCDNSLVRVKKVSYENRTRAVATLGNCQPLFRALLHVSKERQSERDGERAEDPSRALHHRFLDCDWWVYFRLVSARIDFLSALTA
jgi:polyphosphate kinase 2 (PPK2 family)